MPLGVTVFYGVDKGNVVSADNDDLAIINIDKVPSGSAFVKTLEKRGYIPIELDDIDTAFNVKLGQGITAIGFPNESVVGNHPYPLAFYAIHSWQITLPTVSTGFYLHEVPNRNFFEASIFVYHGFSVVGIIIT